MWKKISKQQDSQHNGDNEFVKWKTTGQELIGKWKGKKKGKFGFFGIMESEEEDVLFSLPLVLGQNLDEITEGSEIKIVYLGKKKGNNGFSYHDFEVYRKEE